MSSPSSTWARFRRLGGRTTAMVLGRRAPLSAVVRDGRNALTPLDRRELRRLRDIPRFQPGNANFFGNVLRFTDGGSFVSAFEAIFGNLIYDFHSGTAEPVIIDCGANIGLASLYWSVRFPSAKIIAFEPDPQAFELMKANLRTFDAKRVELRNEAVWIEEGDYAFHSDGADAGRLTRNGQDLVRAIRLAEFLSQPIDFLKLDIEGAEADVIADCEHQLRNIKAIFIEYHGFVDETRRLGSLLNIIARQGFRYWIHPEFAPEHPLVEVSSDLGMDMRLNIFARRDEHAG